MDEFLESKFDNLISAKSKKDKSKNTFLRTLSGLSAGLLGLLVGLKPAFIDDQIAKMAFIACLISIASCIIFSIGAIYRDVINSNGLFKIRQHELNEYMFKKNEYSLKLFHNAHWVFSMFELLALLSMSSYLVLLIIYVYHLEY